MERPKQYREAGKVISPVSDLESAVQIRKLESEIFDWEVDEEDLDELEEKIKEKENITLVIRDSEGVIVGYILATPSLTALQDIKDEDLLYEAGDNKIYIDTLALSKSHRGNIAQIKDLLSSLLDEARKRSYQIVSGHIPAHHLTLYKRFTEVEVLRTLEDWFGSGEDHYYIEVKL